MENSSVSHKTSRRHEWWFAQGVWCMALTVRALPRLVAAHGVAALEQELERAARAPRQLASPWVTVSDAAAARLERRAQELRSHAAGAVGGAVPDSGLSGDWAGIAGDVCRLDQYGERLILTVTDGEAVLACGEGLVTGADVWLQVESADGSLAEATLTWSGDRLEGDCLDYGSGRSLEVHLLRLP